MKAVVSVNVNELSSEELAYLKRLGLSDHEIQTYQLLLGSFAPVTAQGIASKLTVFPSAVYRMFKKLEPLGLIYRLEGRPISYSAVDKAEGFRAAYQQEISNLQRMLSKVGLAATGELQTRIVIGRQANYEEYIRLADKASREVCVYAIGIAYSKELYETQKSAIKRGVYIKHVVQRLQPKNYHIISKWQRLGVNVRHLSDKQGYHVVVIDREVALVTFSDPENTEDRVAIVTRSPSAVRLFQLQFDSIWQQASEIK